MGNNSAKSFLKWPVISLLILMAGNPLLQAQFHEFPYKTSIYDFINYDSNQVEFFGETGNFSTFYNKLDSVINFGKGQINIVIIGGSHIQADIYSGQVRNRFQSFYGGQNAGMGLLFPYRLARTNTPFGYHFDYEGQWETCRNVEKNKICRLGLAGIMAVTKDSVSKLILKIEPENPIPYQMEGIKVLHRTDSFSFKIQNDLNLYKSIEINKDLGYTEILFRHPVDSFSLEIVKTDSIQTAFELYGFLPINRNNGVVLHNIGINGAATSSFLACELMEPQLALIQPDLVIFGLGINDAYGRRFDEGAFERNYNSLIEMIKRINPQAAILLATNNDSYLYKRYINRNGLIVQETMKQLSHNHNVAVWDMFEIMGGLNSIQKWKKTGLAKYDMVHFTREGYILLGDLLFDAIIKSWGEYLYSHQIPNQKSIQ
ncbi:MAG: hypothetical protein JXR34_03505 [Bacteroidales bacterium]|nr:hypothetical protein [Bacteroidales bacterium]